MKGEMCTMRKVIGVLAAFVALAALSVPLPAADGPVTIVLPNAASIVGAAPFFSDVRVFNTSYSDGVDVMATYRCFLGTCPATAPQFLISLSPRQSMALDDICVSAFGAPNSAGGVEFDYVGESEQVVVTSRLYSTSPTPTVGMFIPALELSEAFPNTVLTSLENGGSGGGFRTNSGAFNAGSSPVTATFRVFDGSTPVGNAVTRTVPAHSGVQINQVFREAGVQNLQTSNGVVTVTASGPVFSYAVVIDNDTSDPIFVRGAEDKPFQATTPAPTTTQNEPTHTPTRTPTPPAPTPTPTPPGGQTRTVNVGVGGALNFVDTASLTSTTTISVGMTVKWTWMTGFHSTTSTTPGIWDSGEFSAPHTFSRTFSQAGNFPYFCTVHGQIMSGTVIVNP
jgi:plastocyanin